MSKLEKEANFVKVPKIDSIKLNYFLNWYYEFRSIINAQLKAGHTWPLEIDIDEDTSILIHKKEWAKVKEAHDYHTT